MFRFLKSFKHFNLFFYFFNHGKEKNIIVYTAEQKLQFENVLNICILLIILFSFSPCLNNVSFKVLILINVSFQYRLSHSTTMPTT